jgi:hypothetical protein
LYDLCYQDILGQPSKQDILEAIAKGNVIGRFSSGYIVVMRVKLFTRSCIDSCDPLEHQT